MYKLLIVDDEPFILDGLTDLFQENGDLDVYKASSGDKALEVLGRTRMDIVLTDIQMPGLSGLALLMEIHRRWPYCKVIILTAYSDFQYAHQAIEHRAAGYVLKSEGEEAIVRTVEACIAQIGREMQTQAFLQESEQYLASALPMLQSACLLKVLEGEPEEEYREDFAKYQMRLDPEQPAVLVLLRLDKSSLRSTAHSQLNVLIQVKLIFENYLSGAFTGYEATFEGKNMIWLLQRKEAGRGLLYLKETLEIIQAHALQALSATVSIIYDDYAAWEDLPSRFRAIKLILQQMAVNNEESILANSRFYLERQAGEVARSELGKRQFLLPELQSCLEEEDEERFAAVLAQLLQEEEGTRDNMVAHLELYHSLTSMLLAYMGNRSMAAELLSDLESFELFYRYSDRAALARGMGKLAGRLFELSKKSQATHSQNFAARIRHYIGGHLAGDLSLSALAEQFYIHPVYMSRLYKQTTGDNLTDYITRKRMELSQRLLVETEYKIHQIAKEAGYDSAAYFTRVFKKQTGVTPHEYRDRYVPKAPD